MAKPLHSRIRRGPQNQPEGALLGKGYNMLMLSSGEPDHGKESCQERPDFECCQIPEMNSGDGPPGAQGKKAPVPLLHALHLQ